ncbi:MAG: hypothetical protein ABW128_07080 [Rhizorhabdus sp.]
MIYITRGQHWRDPGTPSKAFLGLSGAQAECAGLVNILRKDMLAIIDEDGAGWDDDQRALAGDTLLPVPEATAEDWESVLRIIQTLRGLELGSIDTPQEVDDWMAGLISDDELECDVWIEELDIVDWPESTTREPIAPEPTSGAAQVFPDVLAMNIEGGPGTFEPLRITPPAMLDLPEETDPDDEPTNIVAAGLDLLDRVGWTLCNGDTVRFLDAAAPDGPTIYRMTITKEA